MHLSMEAVLEALLEALFRPKMNTFASLVINLWEKEREASLKGKEYPSWPCVSVSVCVCLCLPVSVCVRQ